MRLLHVVHVVLGSIAVFASTKATNAWADASSAPVTTPAAAAAVFAKGPYLQALGSDGVTVKFELASPDQAKVEVFPAGGTAAVASRQSTSVQGFQALRVSGLTPATSYEYRVTSHGVASETGRFTTSPADTRPFRFLAYGDSRSDPEAHAAVVRAMAAAPSDFLINTGDLVSMGNQPDDWRELFAIEGRMLRDRCVFAAVGNHELALGDPKGEVAFLRYFAGQGEGPVERLYSTFRWSNTRFFVLNAMDTWTGDERAWLRAELDRALTEPGLVHRFAVMHWGPFSSGPHGNNRALADGEVLGIMRDRKVDLVLAGHDHIYERGEGQGLKYVITGGAGAPLYPKKRSAPETLHFEAAYHFLDVAVDGDHVAITARRASGGVLEACGFAGPGAWDCDPVKPAANPAAAAPPSTTPGVRTEPARAGSGCACATGASSDASTSALAAFAASIAIALDRARRRPRR